MLKVFLVGFGFFSILSMAMVFSLFNDGDDTFSWFYFLLYKKVYQINIHKQKHTMAMHQCW